MNLAWNLTGTERLLYYDSVEELGRLACFKCLKSFASFVFWISFEFNFKKSPAGPGGPRSFNLKLGLFH